MTQSKHVTSVAHPLEKLIGKIATGEQSDRALTDDGRDLAAVLLGRLGGLKGGRARAESLTSERRSEIARLAAVKRWSKESKKP